MSDEFDIAIVGMAGRFPGARDLDEFWANLAGGVESITCFGEEELLAAGVPAASLRSPDYVKAAPVLDEPGRFDAAFFGYSPMEARTMDPQHRLLLELAWQALEHAGCDPARYAGRVGVFAGSALNTYFMNSSLNGRLAENYIPTLIGNDKDFLSTRISYKLDLKGPSLTVQTACSTSMVAVHLARGSLLSGETDMALAGAVSVRVPHRTGYHCDSGGVVSPDARVRAFDAAANGTVFGSGGGILVLKRLADARADGDTIHAVIKGSAVNNDGSAKAGYTAPSVGAQADAVVEALSNAGIEADAVSYVEAHGSGTPLGDPIEVRALTRAFRTFTRRSGYCALGSVKTNVGHLDAAAAVTGIIKTVLALEHRQLPPSLNFSAPNPEIDFPSTPFYVNTELKDWTSEGPRRAGVMSTGMGGTNAHVVLEEAPEPAASAEARGPHLIVVSAKTEAALERATHRLGDYLERDHATSLRDVAYTLQVGRKSFAHRRALVCADREDALTALRGASAKRVLTGRVDEAGRPVVLLLPGIGDHYVGMAHGLYEEWPHFRETVDRCARILQPHLGLDIRTVLYPVGRSFRQAKGKSIDLKKMLGRGDAAQDAHARALDETRLAQPALFTIEYATARLWESLGIVPDAIVGHSMGEYVAACLSGVLTLEDALRLIAVRARLVGELPQGGMLAVTLPERELLPLLPAELSISLINGPQLCVVAGPADAIAGFERTLSGRNVICRRVRNGHAFHSKMLEPIAAAFEQEVRAVKLAPPSIPYISNVTGTWITRAQAASPGYWVEHATRAARFSDALAESWKYSNPILLEAGPGRTLVVLAMQHPARTQGGDPLAVPSIRHDYENHDDSAVLRQGVARLWLAGADIRWEALYAGERRRRVPLPTYPFEGEVHWLDEKRPPAVSRQEEPSGMRPFEEWFYAPAWKREAPSAKPRAVRDDAFWLVVGDRYGGGARWRAYLEGRALPTAFARLGEKFAFCADGSFEIDAKDPASYLQLLEAVHALTPAALHVIHLGAVTHASAEAAESDRAASQEPGFYSLLYLAQAIGELDISIPVTIGIVTNRVHDVTGEERLAPHMATVLGPCGVIPKEFANVGCFSVDLPDDRPVDAVAEQIIARVVSEFSGPSRGDLIAYRGRHRWRRDFERVSLAAPAVASAPAQLPRRLKRHGVYVITGGTGGIGLAVSKYLARTCRPRLVLTRRSGFPEKSQWAMLSVTRDATASVLKTIDALIEIEALGAEVEVQVAEASSRSAMQSVLSATRARYGTIDGVIHAAGIVRSELIQSKTAAIAASVLAPKVEGTLALFDLLQDAPPDFLVLFSSMTAIDTPYAQCDYSAANCFLDAFTGAANAFDRLHVLTINWPGWKETGLLAELEMLPGMEGWKDAALEKAITTQAGVEAFARALDSDHEHLIVSPEDLSRVIERARAPVDPAVYGGAALRTGATRATPAGADQPTNEVEAAIAEIWRGVFGLEHIGIHETFAHLGGHSLVAMQIVSKLRSLYDVRLSLKEFFEASSIAELGVVIQARILSEIESLTDDEARVLVRSNDEARAAP